MAADQQIDRAQQELVERLRAAQQKRAAAARSITLMLLGTVVVYVFLIWNSVLDFRRHRLPEFTAALNEEASHLAPKVADEMQGMMNRLYPRYVDAFQTMFERDMDKMQAECIAQMELLEAHARERWPDVQEELGSFVFSVEETCKAELGRYVAGGDAEAVCVSAGKALHEQYEQLLAQRLRDHVAVAREIGENLEKMLAAEPDISHPIAMTDALGVTLELAGLELQQGF